MRAATLFAASQQGTEFYAWSFPCAPIQVHLCLEVVQGIQECLKNSGPDASVSARGLLLGKIDKPGLAEVTGFRSLATGRPAELEDAIALFKNSGDNLLPIGYFRTHAEDQLALSPDDVSLAQTYFPDPNCVFLLIQPSDAGAAKAGFFYWDKGKMNGGFYDFCFLEFPFDVSLLTADRQGNAKTKPPPLSNSAPVEPLSPTADATLSFASPLPETNSTPVEQPESVQETKRNPGTTTASRRSWHTIRLALTAVLLAVAGLAAGIFLPERLSWIIGMNAEPTPIALKVERQDTNLAVNWNHNSPLVTRAECGRLTMYDGASREFSLNKEYLRSGSVVYSPVTDQVRVQLDLFSSDRKIASESVMVILHRSGNHAPIGWSTPFHPFYVGDASTGAPRGTSPASNRVMARREFLPPQDRAAAQVQPPELAPPAPVTAMNSAPAVVLAPALTLPHSQPPPMPKVSSTVNAVQPSERLPPSENTQAKPQPATPTPSPQAPASPPPQSERPAIPPAKLMVTTERPQQTPPPSLSGSWAFSPAFETGSPFPPDTVTLAITEAYGQVRGLFVGRYRVPKNRKFNPNVKFSFEGPVHSDSSKFPFTTTDGMKGEVELIRLPNKQDAIEVVWYSKRDKLTFDDVFFRKP